jgi:hypothetical protein
MDDFIITSVIIMLIVTAGSIPEYQQWVGFQKAVTSCYSRETEIISLLLLLNFDSS